MYLNSIYFGPKVLIQGLHKGQRIYFLGTWTLRERLMPGIVGGRVRFGEGSQATRAFSESLQHLTTQNREPERVYKFRPL